MEPPPGPDADQGDTVAWRVPPEASGERLDRHLAAHLELPRNQVQRWVEDGRVEVEGARVKASLKLAAGDRIECRPPPPRVGDERIEPEPGELAVLHEDGELVVIDKPAGITVHPGAGRRRGTLAHRLLARYPEMAGVGGAGRPGIVHRLDHGTSGVMALARTAAAHRRLAADFAERRVGKRYLALVYGELGRRPIEVDAAIGRHPVRRTEMAVREAAGGRAGRPARTVFHRLASASGVTLAAADLLTGRTHQIRVHAKHLGRPLVGDPVYGEARWKSSPPPLRRRLADFPRPALHAWRLALTHPGTGERMIFEAPWPPDLDALWQGLGGGEVAAIVTRTGLPELT